MTTRHKHADLIIAWANGATIQYLNTSTTAKEKWWDCSDNCPLWHVDIEYRIKPKPKVKKWRWVFKSSGLILGITRMHWASKEEIEERCPECTAIQKIDSTEIEVEED